MKTQPIANWKIVATVALMACGTAGTGCTQEETDAILAGVQVAADELNNDDEVTFRDWLSSELND